jgi:ParB-like chromosome segregation protein Spo0J
MSASTQKPRTGDAGPPRKLPAAGKRGGSSSTPELPTPQASAKSWRDVLPVHPAAEIFPRMGDDELRALAEDIKQHGLKVPVIFFKGSNGEISLLDGISRLDAMELAGIAPVEDGNLAAGLKHLLASDKDGNPFELVASLNAHRRHLTAEQKRDLIAALLKATPEKSNRQIAETVKADHKTVGLVRTGMEGRGEIPHVEIRTDTKGRKQPAKAAKARERLEKPRKHKRTSKEMKMLYRIQRLGAVYERIKGTSLDQPRELDALFDLGDAPTDARNACQGGFDPARVEDLVARAEQGEAVSALAVLAECKKLPPITLADFIEGWKHCRLLADWLRAGQEVRQGFINYLIQHNSVDPEQSADKRREEFAAADDGLDIPEILRRSAK